MVSPLCWGSRNEYPTGNHSRVWCMVTFFQSFSNNLSGETNSPKCQRPDHPELICALNKRVKVGGYHQVIMDKGSILNHQWQFSLDTSVLGPLSTLHYPVCQWWSPIFTYVGVEWFQLIWNPQEVSVDRIGANEMPLESNLIAECFRCGINRQMVNVAECDIWGGDGGVHGCSYQVYGKAEKDRPFMAETIHCPWLPKRLPGQGRNHGHFFYCPSCILRGCKGFDLEARSKTHSKVILVSQ